MIESKGLSKFRYKMGKDKKSPKTFGDMKWKTNKCIFSSEQINIYLYDSIQMRFVSNREVIFKQHEYAVASS